jgi:hypothetical protein
LAACTSAGESSRAFTTTTMSVWPRGPFAHGAERREEALALAIGGDDQRVAEGALERVGGRRLGLA